ncbi:MAG: hypothetical protein HKN48_02730, partial [Flavobacteriaceae bacterium]|nr:hypothetical protein [Flavobacteriaceae bacterium]
MRSIIFLLLASLGTLATAQNDEAHVDKLTSEFTQKLSERNIEQYAVSKRHCSGTIEMFQINGKVCSS